MKGRITINAKDTKKKQTYGNGSIYFVESRHRFAGQVYLTIDGEKERRTVYGKTKKIVKDKMRELQIQALAGNLEKRNRNKVEIKTIHQLAEKMIEEQVQNDSTGQLQNAQDIYNSMSEEDKQTVNDMIESKVSPQTISDVSKYAKDQDKEGLKQYVKEKFTESEIRQMKDLYNKYK